MNVFSLMRTLDDKREFYEKKCKKMQKNAKK